MDADYNDVQKVQITYDQFGQMMSKMVEDLKGHEYTAVHGLPRGGLSIAVHLSHFLGLPLVMSINHFINEFPEGGKILVVDDIIDTGRTFERFLEIAEIKKIDFETATLFYKAHSAYQPDYYVQETNDWIIFPWEPVEEIPNRECYSHLGGCMESENNGVGILNELDSEHEGN